MKSQRLITHIRQFAWRLLLVWIIAIPSSLLAAPTSVSADVKKISPVQVVGVFAAYASRNKVYKTANAFINRRNELSDRYHAKALEQLRDRELLTHRLRPSQLSAYIKVVALIEKEREAMIQFAEAEKKAAHTKFIKKLNNAFVNVILSTSAVTRVLDAMQNGLRSSTGFINHALDTLAGGGGGVLAEIQEVRQIASYVSLAGEVIGGKTGSEIRTAANRIVRTINGPPGIKAGLEQARAELGGLSTRISDLQARGRQTSAGEVAREGLISAVTGEQADPSLEAIIDLLGRNRGENFRTRARTALIGQNVARCTAIGDRYRKILFKLELSATGEDTLDSMVVPSCSVVDVEELAREESGKPTIEQKTATVTPGSKTATQKSPVISRTPTQKPPANTLTPTQKSLATTRAPTHKATQQIRQIEHPCEVMPPGGKHDSNSNWECAYQFATEPGERLIWITMDDRLDLQFQQNTCQSISKNSDYHTVMSEYPLGICGYRLDINSKGKKSLAYKGWSIQFVLDRFTVQVYTNEEYPANKDWVESMAAKIEANIQSHLDAPGN